jgi:hypothetical protein
MGSRFRRYRLRAAQGLSVLVIPLFAAGCGESAEDKRRAEFEAGLRDAMTAQQVPESLIECTVNFTRKTITDDVIAETDADANAGQLATMIAQRQPQLAAACQFSPLAR